MAAIVDKNDVVVVVYLDDIVIYGNDPVKVWEESRIVLERLASAGFMVNTAKSHFLVSSIKMLGYHLSDGRRLPPYTQLKATVDAAY